MLGGMACCGVALFVWACSGVLMLLILLLMVGIAHLLMVQWCGCGHYGVHLICLVYV